MDQDLIPISTAMISTAGATAYAPGQRAPVQNWTMQMRLHTARSFKTFLVPVDT
jgi:hypothetical protein